MIIVLLGYYVIVELKVLFVGSMEKNEEVGYCFFMDMEYVYVIFCFIFG